MKRMKKKEKNEREGVSLYIMWTTFFFRGERERDSVRNREETKITSFGTKKSCVLFSVPTSGTHIIITLVIFQSRSRESTFGNQLF